MPVHAARGRSLLLATALGCALLSAAGANAWAQSAAPPSASPLDSVALRDGTILRGHVTVMHPQVDLTIALLDGTSRTIAWADIRATDGPAFAFAAGPAPVPPPMPPPPPSAPVENDLRDPGPGRVPIVLDSIGARLALGTFNDVVHWSSRTPMPHQEVCFSPCTLYVRPGLFPLYIGGDGIVPGIARLDVPASGMRVHLRSPRTAAMVGLLVGTVGSILSSVAGIEMVVFAPRDAVTHRYDDGWRNAGYTFIGLGVVALVANLVGIGFAVRQGVASSEPLAPSNVLPSLRIGVMPERDGATVGASVRF
jgi:hypothetical protein